MGGGDGDGGKKEWLYKKTITTKQWTTLISLGHIPTATQMIFSQLVTGEKNINRTSGCSKIIINIISLHYQKHV